MTLVAGTPPTVTVAPVTNPVPVIVIGAAPSLPALGLMPVTVGTGS